MAKKKKNRTVQTQPAEPAVDSKKIKKEKRVVTICLLTALALLLIAGMVYAAITAEKENAVNNQTAETQEAEQTSTSAEETTEVQETEPAETQESEPAQTAEQSTSDFDTTLNYYADITVENYGTITVALDAEAAPLTVQNFVELARSGFYDGLTFHRIMDGFMMQGGDPTGTGSGGADYNIPGEFSANGWDNPLSHTRGAISMARSKDYDSASSQFFIVQSDSTSLDGIYACFGYVTEGMEYVDAICADAEPTDNNGTIPAEAQPVISTIVIRTA